MSRSDKPYEMAWPEDGSPMSIEDLMRPLRRVLTALYIRRRRHPRVNVPWHGPPLLDEFLANGPDPHSQLLAENLIYSEDDQGRDALDEFIMLALRVGMTQGVKWQKTRASSKVRALRIRVAGRLLDRLEGDPEAKAYVAELLSDLHKDPDDALG